MEITERLVFQAPKGLVDRIDDWRFAQRAENRADAIRRLIIFALDAYNIGLRNDNTLP